MQLRFGILITFIIAFCGACSEKPPADLVVLNGQVLTVDSEFSKAEAVAIRDGIFVAVGTNDEVREFVGEETRVIDAGGKTVTPGLIASHTHATSVVKREYATPHPFEQLGSIGEIQRWLRTEAEKTPQGEWIQLPRVDVTRIREGRIPKPEELDEAAPNHPAVFTWQFANRKIQVMNQAALEAAGINAETQAPEGGHIAVGEDGKPTGVMENSGELTEKFLEPREIPEDRYHDDLERLLGYYNEVGITSIGERGSDVEGYHTYQKLKEEGRLPVRVTVTIYLRSDGSVEDTEKYISSLPVHFGEGDDQVKVGPLKIRVDGGILYGSAYMRESYGQKAISFYGFEDPAHHGTLLISPEKLNNMIYTGQRLGWQMSAHVTGNAGVDAVLDAVEEANVNLPDQDRRFTLIHAYFADRETAERAARLGVPVDTQPAWYYKDGDALAEVLSKDLMERFLGLQTWKSAGVKVAINSDHMQGFDPNASLNPYNPFLTMYVAISRRTEGGKVFGPEQRVSREEALRMMTIDAAWMNFEEKQKGSIEIGKLADLAILSDDLLNCEEEEFKDIRSRVTIVGGKIVYDAGGMDNSTADSK